MANNKRSQNQSGDDPAKENMQKTKQKTKETLKEAEINSAVKDALKKEKQPVNPDDLSSLHNTREIGTSGGDQRASETEPNEEG